MLNINGKNIVSMMVDGKMLSAMYRNGRLIWQAVRSCFGSGVWVSRKPWIGSEKWKNHK